MAKRGRKTLFKKEMLNEAYKLGALGLTMEEIADFWSIKRDTLQKWCAKNPDFLYIIKKGRKEADLTVIQSILNQAKEGNIAGAIFWLKNRCGWKDSPQVVIETAPHIITPHAVIFSAVKEEINISVKDECQPRL